MNHNTTYTNDHLSVEEKRPPSSSRRCNLAVVIPVFNEFANIPACYLEMVEALSGCGYSYELIFVDDGSRDGSFEKLMEIAQQDDHVTILRLEKNLGQQKALLAGLSHCDADAVVTFDADLQIPADCIPQFVEKILMGHDIVSGMRLKRKDSFFMNKTPSFIGRYLINKALGIQIKDFGSPKAYSPKVVNEILLEISPHLIIPAAAFHTSKNYCEIPVEHRPRRSGRSKWSFFKRMETYFDIYVMYSARPFNWMMMTGGISFFLSFLFAIGIVSYKIFVGRKFAGTIIFFDFFLFFTGIHFISLALIGEFVLRIYRFKHFSSRNLPAGVQMASGPRKNPKTQR